MSRPGCCLGSLGCLIIGALLGALAVWLLIPRLTRKGYTPDQAAEAVEQRMSDLSREARSHVAAKVSDLKDSVWETASDSAVPPEPLLDSELQELSGNASSPQTTPADSSVADVPPTESGKKPRFP